ncbi:cold shock domain-containing protein [Bradyrhizobium jicamae]|uniref:Cold shock domain-containing protein n=1 Tax=Bradyrhizobium jicamae TaxID=280332 RepID=A0ABS5FB90_9BRAD|nr:cold shock domain-containing protein [Bradyrhizobium jicamae]MBR0793974.1 cold shock domain-containing protein [Bradyrhizobium jicamae]
MKTGRCTYWSERAFGWIRPDDRSADVFVHITGLVDGLTELKVGQRVSFSIVEDKRTFKPKAIDVRVLAS